MRAMRRAAGGIALTVGLLASAMVPTGAASTTAALNALRAELTSSLSITTLPSTTVPALAPLSPKWSFSIPSLINDCTPATDATTEPLCTYGDTTAKATVVLYGNSEAQSWAPALDLLGQRHNFRVIVLAKPACGVLLDPDYLGPSGRLVPTCYDFDAWAATQIAALRPAELIISSTPGQILSPTAPHDLRAGAEVPAKYQTPTTPARTAADLARFLARAHVAGSQVLVLGAIPTKFTGSEKASSPNACLLQHEDDISACTMVQPTYANNEWFRSLFTAATKTHAHYVDVSKLLCVTGGCPLVVDTDLVHFNTLHVGGPYARLVAPAMAGLILKYLP